MCFVMELCRQSLFKLLHDSKTPLSEDTLIRYATDVAEGIKYLHSRRPVMIHRDIKTHNLLISDDGRVKLCDFGLVTTRATTAGTPNYMAPELLGDAPFSKAVDVYAFGVVLWELFARKVPFMGWRPADIKEQVLAGDRPPIPKFEWPEMVVSLIRRCWDQDPDKRPPITAVVEELHAYTPYVSAVSALAGGGGDALDSLLFK